MNFLRKHYEKLILAVLLAVFIILLTVQLGLWSASKDIQNKQYQDPAPNYVRVDFDKNEAGFRVLENLGKFTDWSTAREREGMAGAHTDFMQPYPMSLCPSCVRVIPRSVFPPDNSDKITRCPLCNGELVSPKKAGKNDRLDTDGDRIPDQEEIRLGLNPEDGVDGDVDRDGDGFANYEEYLFKTDHTNSMKHPPYYMQLHVAGFVRPTMVRVRNISIYDTKDLSRNRVQLEFNREDNWKRKDSRYYGLSECFTVEKPNDKASEAAHYRIKQIIPKIEMRNGVRTNLSEIVVVRVDAERHNVLGGKSFEYKVKREIGKPFRMKIGGNIFAHWEDIILVRTFGEWEWVEYDNNKKRNKKERRNRFTKEDVRRLNDVFTIGSLKSGEETYKVVSADAKKKEVVLLYNDRKVTISSESLVAREIRKAPKLTRPPKRKSNNNNI